MNGNVGAMDRDFVGYGGQPPDPKWHNRIEEGGFLYDSDAYNGELPYWTTVQGQRHLVVPYSLSANDMKFARTFATGDDFFNYCFDAFDFLYREGASQPKMMSIGLHLRMSG